MNKLFYPKLAITNIRKNYQTYIPYMLTGIGTIMMYYIMKAISVDQGLERLPGSGSLKSILSMGSFVVGLFALIFLFYTNSFLIKRRKKELGLYNILGMEKKHISKIMMFETLFVSFICIVTGMLGGMVLSKLMYMVLLKILNFEVPMGYQISFTTIYSTLILFCIIFLLTFLNNMRQVHLANPIELLKGGQVGEKEPKTKWLMTLIGIVALLSGYFIAVTVESPLKALSLFFIAVILVIIGTYYLFTAGSIALLKVLRRNKKYYYQTKHFTSVSGMIYRMKQNAVGLASICILSTAVLVMLSTTVSLYIGMEDVLRNRFKRNVTISTSDITEEYTTGMKEIIESVLEKHNRKAENTLEYRCLTFVGTQEMDSFNTDMSVLSDSIDTRVMYLIPLKDYNIINGTSETLENDEVLLYTTEGTYQGESISLLNKTFKIKDTLDSFTGDKKDTTDITNNLYVIVKDIRILEELNELQIKEYDQMENYFSHYYGFDLNAEDQEITNITREIRFAFEGDFDNSHIVSASESKAEFFSIYGGLFFLGIFLGALFIMATVLIIYYKQISEGYDDKSRFEIMQKVGMSRSEIKKSIHSQVLTVFFLPIITAAIHILFAFKVITRLLAVLGLMNVTLFAWCTVGTLLIFAVFYAIIYGLTARVYYKIVS